jgi:hypothetical protein
MKNLHKLLPIILAGVLLIFILKWSKDGTLASLWAKVQTWLPFAKTGSNPNNINSVAPGSLTAQAVTAGPVGNGSLIGPVGLSSTPPFYSMIGYSPNAWASRNPNSGLSPYDISFWNNPQLYQNPIYWGGGYTGQAATTGGPQAVPLTSGVATGAGGGY